MVNKRINKGSRLQPDTDRPPLNQKDKRFSNQKILLS